MRRRSFTITQWLGMTAGVLVVVGVAGMVAGLVALARLTDARELLADRLDPAAATVSQLEAALIDQETGVRGFVLDGREQFLAPYESGREEEPRLLARLDSLLSGDARRTLDDVEAATATWHDEFAMPTIDAVRAGDDGPPDEVGKAQFDAARAELAALQEDLAVARTTARADLARQADIVTWSFVAFGVALLATVVAAALVLQRVVVNPLTRLAADVREVARGGFGRELKAGGAREVAELGADVDSVRRRIVSEVAELQRAEEDLIRQAQELQRSNAELEQFAYVASHDLQEPLRKVASFCQMIEQRYKGQLDERGEQYIEFAVDGAKRMQQLINDLLAFSRVGRLTQPHEVVDTGELVARAQRALAAAIEESDTEVVANGLPRVRGDATLLALVFQNLIGNAIKFRGEAPPRVAITAERDGGQWRFACADNGIGIEDEYADRIFVIFQRLHPRTAYEGTGIGLAMCKKIIEYHGGRIWLADDVAEGSTFLFTLPVLEDATA